MSITDDLIQFIDASEQFIPSIPIWIHLWTLYDKQDKIRVHYYGMSIFSPFIIHSSLL